MPTNPDQAPSFPSSEQQAQSSAVACDYACPLPPSPSTQPESDSSAGAPQNAIGTTSNSATISNSEQPEPDKEDLLAQAQEALDAVNQAKGSLYFDPKRREQDVKSMLAAVKEVNEPLYGVLAVWRSTLKWLQDEYYGLFKAFLAYRLATQLDKAALNHWNERLGITNPIEPDEACVSFIIFCLLLDFASRMPYGGTEKVKCFALALYCDADNVPSVIKRTRASASESLSGMLGQLCNPATRLIAAPKTLAVNVKKGNKLNQAKYSGRANESCKTHSLRNGSAIAQLEADTQRPRSKESIVQTVAEATTSQGQGNKVARKLEKTTKAYVESKESDAKPKKPGGTDSKNQQMVRGKIDSLQEAIAKYAEDNKGIQPDATTVADMAKGLGIVSATYVPQGVSLDDTINVIIGASRFYITKAGHAGRATAEDSEIVNVTLAVKWGIYIDPKTKETRLLPYNSGCGIDLPLHFQGAIPARHVFQQIIERLTTSVSSQICVERLKAVGIDWKVQSFNKACKAVNDYIFAPFAQMIMHGDRKVNLIAMVDETPIFIYEVITGKSSKKATRRYVICVNAGPHDQFPSHQFVVAEGRSFEHIAEVLRPYLEGKTLVVSDRYQVYAKLGKEMGFKVQYCQAHAKRYIYEVTKPYIEAMNQLEADAIAKIMADQGYQDTSELTEAEIAVVNAQVEAYRNNLPLDIRVMMVCGMINTAQFQISKMVQKEWQSAMAHSETFAKDGHLSPEDYRAVSAKVNQSFGDDITFFKDAMRMLLESVENSEDDEVKTGANYVLKELDAFFTYIDFPELPIDNNMSERMMRIIAAIRKAQQVNQSEESLEFFCNGQTCLQTLLALGYTKDSLLEIMMDVWDARFAHVMTHLTSRVIARDGDTARVQAGLNNMKMGSFDECFPFHEVIIKALDQEKARLEKRPGHRPIRAIPKVVLDTWVELMAPKVAQGEAAFQATNLELETERLQKGQKRGRKPQTAAA